MWSHDTHLTETQSSMPENMSWAPFPVILEYQIESNLFQNYPALQTPTPWQFQPSSDPSTGEGSCLKPAIPPANPAYL